MSKSESRDGHLILTTAEANARDAGRGIARLDPEDMKALGLEIGHLVEIRGKRAAYAKVMPAFVEHREKKLIQVDGLVRENAACGLNEKVRVQPADAQPATQIVLEPLTRKLLDREGEYVASLLDGLPVQEGDRVRATLFGSRWIDFKVMATRPKGV
ncbi:MAG: AAA family ATPase, partial [Planctomycetota bacterium]